MNVTSPHDLLAPPQPDIQNMQDTSMGLGLNFADKGPEFMNTDRTIKKLEKGFVTLRHGPNQYFYCLHCDKWFKKSQTAKHTSETIGADLDIAKKVLFYKENMASMQPQMLHSFNDFVKTVQVRKKKGALDGLRKKANMRELVGFEAKKPGGMQLGLENCNLPNLNMMAPEENKMNEEYTLEYNIDNYDKWDMSIICKYIKERCFVNEEMNIQKVVNVITRLFNGEERLKDRRLINSVQRKKADIVSEIISDIFVRVGLTRQQVTEMNSIIQMTFAVLSPQSVGIISKVHTSYQSCVRRSVSNGTMNEKKKK
ncbi:hypothetical protein EIN_428150 [Entamoeba invadens IP1]|uniref:Uncharacterized protein n=1 Tax=Entamoeba invadens IP1 TaxID=370355 RepID=A0A0A1UGT6_ENTIV|nr:hypothetical protein EIN_428150 [Entamoeba invadens IP1]ELP95139.1 hypothetical protein EIN_428150 [Entamoeba invadens IP1]|eukprot:XP_004261910.1 hypothetical protein EIN_428150 [Entamoeba invadens IP1]